MHHSLRIAHISDLHFSKVSFSPLQFFSKRWVGNVNLCFYRKAVYIPERLHNLVELFKSMEISIIIISGDLSTTTLDAELIAAKKFVDTFIKEGFQVFVIPGNHDQYTYSDFKQKKFYNYFPSYFSEKSPIETMFSLRDDGVTASRISDTWWIVGLDTTLATSLFSAAGCFSPKIEKNLEILLQQIPSTDQIILINHFPLFPNDKPRNTLERAHELQRLVLKYPNIIFYIHGHTHRNCVADLRLNGYPIILDSGSTSHQEIGSWNFLEINPHHGQVQIYQKDIVFSPSWKMIKEVSFKW